jgi:3-oxoacyl-[acyl-carrier-protein] synthase III
VGAHGSSAGFYEYSASHGHDGRFKKGDLLLLVAFGAGLTWGATVIRW